MVIQEHVLYKIKKTCYLKHVKDVAKLVSTCSCCAFVLQRSLLLLCAIFHFALFLLSLVAEFLPLSMNKYLMQQAWGGAWGGVLRVVFGVEFLLEAALLLGRSMLQLLQLQFCCAFVDIDVYP